jgi:hypothetical protein
METIPRFGQLLRLTRAFVVSLTLMVALMWVVVSLMQPATVSNQPIDRSIAARDPDRTPDYPGARDGNFDRTWADYWSEVGKAAGNF